MNFTKYKSQSKDTQGESLDCVEGLVLNSLKLSQQKSYNHKEYKLRNEFNAMLKSLFNLLKNHHPSQNENLFLNAWILNPEEAAQSIKLPSVSFKIYVKCLNSNPGYMKLINNLNMEIKNYPNQYNPKVDRDILPISSYSPELFTSQPYLIDLIILE